MKGCCQGIYIGVGSNIDPMVNITKALAKLMGRVKVLKSSDFFMTKPVGTLVQNDFFNGAWEIMTGMPPEKLKSDILRPIENDLKRDRILGKFAPRTIDLDILLYGNLVCKNGCRLTVPDPDIYTRPYLVEALFELYPELILPDTQTPVRSLYEKIIKKDYKTIPEFSSLIKRSIKNE